MPKAMQRSEMANNKKMNGCRTETVTESELRILELAVRFFDQDYEVRSA